MVFQHQDAWRRHPLFTNLYRNPFPGFQKAVVIFGVYLVLETGFRYANAPARISSNKH
jgi:NADH-ubiquinone oxidoreductase B12 subunit family